MQCKGGQFGSPQLAAAAGSRWPLAASPGPTAATFSPRFPVAAPTIEAEAFGAAGEAAPSPNDWSRLAPRKPMPRKPVLAADADGEPARVVSSPTAPRMIPHQLLANCTVNPSTLSSLLSAPPSISSPQLMMPCSGMHVIAAIVGRQEEEAAAARGAARRGSVAAGVRPAKPAESHPARRTPRASEKEARAVNR